MQMHSLKGPHVEVKAVEDYILNSSYVPILCQLEFANLQRFYFVNNLENATKDAPNMKFRNPKYLSMLNHLWFYFPEMYPKLHKILFLDDDVVVQKNLIGLWEINMNEVLNGADPKYVAVLPSVFAILLDGPNDEGEMFTRLGKASDCFPTPYPNEQATRFANGGACPPNLSLNDGAVEYEDGTLATKFQMAKDVVTFLTWESEPKMEEHKPMQIVMDSIISLAEGYHEGHLN